MKNFDFNIKTGRYDDDDGGGYIGMFDVERFANQITKMFEASTATLKLEKLVTYINLSVL